MATSLTEINELITWYLTTRPDERLEHLLHACPLDLEAGTRDRAALRRVYKLLERIEGARNVLLEELASDKWNFAQLSLFE